MHPQTIGNYELQGLIGEGGMGSVYMATHRLIGGRAAIKVLQPQLARNPEIAERFLREAQAATRAEHPGIVRILDYGTAEGGLPYLVMEYVEGQALSKYLAQRGRLPLMETLSLGRQIAAALAAAHQKQVIHRDLKPDNIIRLHEPDGSQAATIRVVDFGIARIETPAELKRLTRTGAFLGTPCYMAPEVVMDPRRACDRSDVYALGIILFQLLAGEPAFVGSSLGEVVVKHLGEQPPLLSQRVSGCPDGLCRLVQAMLKKDPQRRPSMKQVHNELAAIEQSEFRAALLPSARLERRSQAHTLKRLLMWSGPSVLVGALALAMTHHRSPGTMTGSLGPVQRAPERPPNEAAPRTKDFASGAVLSAAGRTYPQAREGIKGTASGWPNSARPAARAMAKIGPQRTGPVAPTAPPVIAESVSTAPSAVSVPATLRNPFEEDQMQSGLGARPSSDAAKRAAAEQYLADASQARLRGDLGGAIKSARLATLGKAESAWAFVASLGCEARDYPAVQDAFLHLSAGRRTCIEEVCRHYGVIRQGASWRVDVSLRRGTRNPDATLALQDANQALRENLYDRAIVSARLAISENYYEAWQTIGRAACQKGDAQLAEDAACRLEPLRLRNVRFVCQQNHVPLPVM